MNADTSYAAEAGANIQLVTTKMLRDKISGAKDYDIYSRWQNYEPKSVRVKYSPSSIRSTR